LLRKLFVSFLVILEFPKAAPLSELFLSHGDGSPSGENLEYEPVFTAMELAAQPEEERQAGKEIVEGRDPDYRDLAGKARAVLERSHDIRAAVYLADSELRLSGLSGFAEATRYIRFCLEDHWATCHPQLDEEDDNDPTMRINAVTNLAGRTTVLRGLRRSAALTDSRAFGAVTIRDIDISKGDEAAPEDESPMSAADIEAAFMDTGEEKLKAFLDSARQSLENVNAIDAIFMEKTPGFGPTLDPLQQLLGRIVGVLVKAVGEDDAHAQETQDDGGDAPVSATASGAAAVASAPGQIASRADVAAALDRIIDYYTKYEPSSPLPVLLKRARRLVGADFITIINDLAPLGVDNVNLVGGINGDGSE
jgi:type VI secretion system protein ImpA